MQHLGESFIFKRNELVIYSQSNVSKIKWNVGNNFCVLDSITSNKLMPLNNKKLLSITSDNWKNKEVANKFEIDYLHIVKNDSISLYSLTRTFIVHSVILDNSLSSMNKKRIIKECKNLEIPYYDMTQNGIFRIIF